MTATGILLTNDEANTRTGPEGGFQPARNSVPLGEARLKPRAG